MAEDERDRKDEVNGYVSSLKERLKKAQEVKELNASNQEQLRNVSVSLDATIDNSRKSIEVLSQVLPSVLDSVKPELWSYFRELKAESDRQVGSLGAVANEVRQATAVGGTVLAMVSGAGSASVIETRFIIGALATPKAPVQNGSRVMAIADTLSDDIGVIQAELESISAGISSRLKEVVKDWSSTPSDRKWQVLLTLRSVVFSQLFETFAKESDYSKTAWYQTGANKGMRYAEPKFFMTGFRKEEDLSPAAHMEIENVSTEFQTNFRHLSDYGKEGVDSSLAEATFRKTLSLLKQSLLVRKTWFRSGP